jgi:hypothetical protein
MVTAAIALALGLVLVAARYVDAAKGDISRFVVAGTPWSDPTKVPHGLHVFSKSPGYDGQFFYRLGLDPRQLGLARHHGIRLDGPARSGRIGYPVLIWVAALGGRDTVVPWAMVAINLLALAAVGALGGRIARRFGQHPAWGLLFAAYWGFTASIARDLSDVVAAALTLGTLVLILDRRYFLAALCLSAAVLTREQALITGTCIVVGGLWAAWRSDDLQSRPDRAKLLPVLLAPAAVLLMWNLTVRSITGEAPVLSTSGNIGLPFVGLAHGMTVWLHDIGGAHGLQFRLYGLLHFAQLAGLLAVGGLAAATWRRTRQEIGVWLALAATTFLLVLLTAFVFDDPLNFRTTYDVFLMATVLLVAGRRWLTPVAFLTGGLWILSAGVMAIRV